MKLCSCNILLLYAFTLFGLAIFCSAEQKSYAPYPAPDVGYITDIADVLTDEQEDELESWIYTTEKRTNFEMAVVIIDSIKDYPGTDNRSIDSFATSLFNKYGIGNMPKNEGVLLLVAVKDRKARIELGAYYGRFRDGDARRIMDKVIIPQFKNEDYARGVQKGVKAILAEFGSVRIIPGSVKLILLAAIAILVLVTVSLFRNGKKGWGWICAGIVIILLLLLLSLLKKTVEHLPEGSSSGGGIGGFGGGFGGGFSGGGGATGSW